MPGFSRVTISNNNLRDGREKRRIQTFYAGFVLSGSHAEDSESNGVAVNNGLQSNCPSEPLGAASPQDSRGGWGGTVVSPAGPFSPP